MAPHSVRKLRELTIVVWPPTTRLWSSRLGPEAKKYYVHRALLVHHLEYFKKALQDSWTEAQTGLFKLPDIEPLVCGWAFALHKLYADLCAVNLFVYWLYSGKVPGFDEYDEWARGTQETSNDQASSAEDSNTEDEDDEFDAWRVLGLRAYAFADRFRVADFQTILNTAIVTHKFDAAVLFDDTLPETECAFAHIPAERPILKLLVDDFCSR